MYEKYIEDLHTYLVNKFPYADTSTLIEATEYITNRTIRLVIESIIDRDNLWRKQLKKLD